MRGKEKGEVKLLDPSVMKESLLDIVLASIGWGLLSSARLQSTAFGSRRLLHRLVPPS